MHSWPLIRMSLMVGSLSSGSSGPRPVISSRISETKSLNSCVLSGRRSTSTYCETSCWTWRRISSSGTLSSAERLISSISRRCRRTLASSSLSLSNGLSAGATACSVLVSGNTVQDTPSSGVEEDSTGGAGSGVVVRRAVNRPAILAYHRELEFLQERHRPSVAGRFRRRQIQHEFLELGGDPVAGLDLIERNAAVDRFADKGIVVWNCAQEGIAERLRKVATTQTRVEHLLGKAIDDHLRMGSLAQPLCDRRNQLLGVAQAGNGGFTDDEQLVRTEQNAVGPREPRARHIKDDIFKIGGHKIEQSRYDVGIK